jgi:hypothetical protein
MSAKSSKISKKIDLPKEVVEKFPNEKIRKSQGLLFIDIKSKVFLGLILGLYIVLSLLKIHYSSTPIWSRLLGNNYGKDLIWGEPKGIRQDEWLIGASVLASNSANDFEVENYSIGGGKSVYAWSFLPIKSIGEIFRPNHWGYFILDFERAFAFDMNSKIVVSILGIFLFLMLITRNNFYLASFGSFWCLLSGASVWWSFSIVSTLGYACLGFVTFITIFSTNKTILKTILGFIFLCSIYGYCLVLYPPFQIPISIFSLILFFGYIIQNISSEYKNYQKWSNWVFIGFLVVILISLLIIYFLEAKETFQLIMNTVYPGTREFLGGLVPLHKLFSETFIWFTTESKLPKVWNNISEASNVLLYFPVVIPIIIFKLINRKIDYFEIAFLIIFTFAFTYIFIGFPKFLAKITLFSMVQDFRALPVFGYFNIIFAIYFINSQLNNKSKISKKELLIVSILVLVFSYSVYLGTNKSLDNFFTDKQVFFVILFYSISSICLYFSRNIKFAAAFILLILFFNAKNFYVNPIVKGLKPMINNELTRQINSIPNLDKEAKWAVFGNYQIADLLKPTGINLFNGTKFPPNLKEMSTLDASAHADSCYNRYAHIALSPFITNTDSIVMMVPKFENGEPINDLYYVYMDPCSSKLKELGVKYFIFTNKTAPNETRCMDLISQGKVMIYQLK